MFQIGYHLRRLGIKLNSISSQVCTPMKEDKVEGLINYLLLLFHSSKFESALLTRKKSPPHTYVSSLYRYILKLKGCKTKLKHSISTYHSVTGRFVKTIKDRVELTGGYIEVYDDLE